MAIVQKGVFLSMTIADYGGNLSTTRLALNYADLAALSTNIADITGAGGLLADFQAVTKGKLVSWSAGVTFGEDGAKVAATRDVQVEEVLEISAKIAGEVDKYAIIRIPAPADGVWLTGPGDNSNTADQSDADLQAYLANFEAGGICTTSDGENIMDSATVGNWKGKHIHRASRKG